MKNPDFRPPYVQAFAVGVIMWAVIGMGPLPMVVLLGAIAALGHVFRDRAGGGIPAPPKAGPRKKKIGEK